MPIITALALQAAALDPPPCRAEQLRLGVGPRVGVADFAPRAGVVLSIRNLGPGCTLPALPTVSPRASGGHAPPITRRAPPGMHPGPVMRPVTLPGGHRATIELAWTPCTGTAGEPCARVRSVTVAIGGRPLRATMRGTILGTADHRFQFDQPPARVAEGMAEG